MRHRKAGRQFSRNTSHRRAMLRALAANLIAHERIETTDPKAKELRRIAERLITKAKHLGPVAYTPHAELSVADRARRQASQAQVGRFLRRFAVIHNGQESRTVDLIEKVFVDLAKRYQSRPGGYTRIIKVGRRRGDGAPMVLVELLQESEGKAEAAKPAAEPEKAGEATADAT
jgi:large subunit ribosomal protein L17